MKGHEVKTGDGLILSLGEIQEIYKIEIDNKVLPLNSNKGGFSLYRVSTGPKIRQEEIKAINYVTKGEILYQHIRYSDKDIDVRYIPQSRCISVEGNVKSTSEEDQAIIVQFIIPIDAVGWYWGEDKIPTFELNPMNGMQTSIL